MAIKKLTFSFDVPLTSLLSLIATGQSDLRIDVLSDDKHVPLSKLLGANGVAGLLEGPRASKGKSPGRAVDASGKPTTAIDLIMAAMANTPDHAITSLDLRPTLMAAGLMPNSVSPQLSAGTKKGWFEKMGHGRYKLTAEGLAECQQRGIAPYQTPEPEPPPPEKATKPKSEKSEKSKAGKLSNGIGARHG